MKVYKVIGCSCGGGKITKQWFEYLFFDKEKAEAKLKEIVDKYNNQELNRTDEFIVKERQEAERTGKKWGRLYSPDTVEGINGWCNWCYSEMIYLEEGEIV